MTYVVELNTASKSEFDLFHIDSLENVAKKNRRMLANGKAPTYVVIGVAQTIGEARHFANDYKIKNGI